MEKRTVYSEWLGFFFTIAIILSGCSDKPIEVQNEAESEAQSEIQKSEQIAFHQELETEEYRFVIYDIFKSGNQSDKKSDCYRMEIWDKKEPASMLHQEDVVSDGEEFVDVISISWEEKEYEFCVLKKLEYDSHGYGKEIFIDSDGEGYRIIVTLGDKQGKQVDLDFSDFFANKDICVVPSDELDGDIAFAWLFVNQYSDELEGCGLKNEIYWEDMGLPNGFLNDEDYSYWGVGYGYDAIKKFVLYQGEPALRFENEGIEIFYMFMGGLLWVDNGSVKKSFDWWGGEDSVEPRFGVNEVCNSHVGSYFGDGKKQIVFDYDCTNGTGIRLHEIQVLDYDMLEEYTIPDFVEFVSQDEEIQAAIDAKEEEWDIENASWGEWQEYHIGEDGIWLSFCIFDDDTHVAVGEIRLTLKAKKQTLYMDSWTLVEECDTIDS